LAGNGAWTIQNTVAFVMQAADRLLDLPGCFRDGLVVRVLSLVTTVT